MNQIAISHHGRKENFIDSINALNRFKILVDENLIIGYYIASFAADECELLNITVSKNYQRQGYGSIIIDHLIKYCLKRKTSNLFLEVRKSNKNAILLYEKKGFNEVGIRLIITKLQLEKRMRC